MDFAPIGAEWWYANNYQWPFPNDIYSLNSVGDTTIQGKDCRIIEYTFHDHDGSKKIPEANLIVSSDADKVYYLLRDTFRVLFDFSAQVGDTLTIVRGPEAGFYGRSQEREDFAKGFAVEIDSTFLMDIGGVLLRAYTVRSLDWPLDCGYPVCLDWFYEDTIVEKIGPIGADGFFGSNTVVNLGGETKEVFHCYSDSVLSLQLIDDCARLFPILSIGKPVWTNAITLSPNPTSDRLQIDLEISFFYEKPSFDLYNASGQKIKTWTATESHLSLEVHTWPAGLYWLHYRTQNGDSGIRKFVVH